MTPTGTTLVIIISILVFILPKKYSAIPFFLTIFYLPGGEKLDIGDFTFFSYRIILVIALVRIIVKKELGAIPLKKFEWLLIICFLWIAFAAGIRSKSAMIMVNSLSSGFDAVLAYFYARSTFEDISQIKVIGITLCLIMVPFMVLMLIEKHTMHNLFSIMNGVREVPLIREGKVRAAGPFAHAILTGSAAAVHFPLTIYVYSFNKVIGGIGCLTVIGTVYASASSGPIMTLLLGALAMVLWSRRDRLAQYRSMFYIICIILEIYRSVFKHGHVWDYIARIDLTGGSTGDHRAALITSWVNHFTEWWIIGTEYTRHWLPTGVTWSANHTDITNHYIAQSVAGGLFATFVFIYIIYKSFANIGKSLRLSDSTDYAYSLWTLGAVLFAHTATFISVAYFDQTILIYYFLIGTISASCLQVMHNTVNSSNTL